jgi:hypothetical protein
VRAQFGDSDEHGNIVLDTTGSRRATEIVNALEENLKDKKAKAVEDPKKQAAKEVLLTADMDEDEEGSKKHKRDAPNVDRSMVAWVVGLSRPELMYVMKSRRREGRLFAFCPSLPRCALISRHIPPLILHFSAASSSSAVYLLSSRAPCFPSTRSSLVKLLPL